jgi:hypothetical protein
LNFLHVLTWRGVPPQFNSLREVLDIDSRQKLGAEPAELGITVEPLHSLSEDQLSDLPFGLRRTANSRDNGTEQSRQGCALTNKTIDNESIALFQIDKKILKALLESKGNLSSIALSREPDIPLSMVQRRHERLEEECVREWYSLPYEKFGKRNITFIISLGAGERSAIADAISS